MKASILVVDDQSAIALSIKKGLMDVGFEVDTASNGEEALVRIEKKNYDIALLDINMPIMNGIQVLEFITAKHPYTDVMMMTAFDDFSLASECTEKGAKDFLLKPVDFTELISRINTLLRIRDSEQRFSNLRNMWQSTVLFDVLGSLRTIQFALSHTVDSLGSAIPNKDLALLAQARELNNQIAHTLKESIKINELAVCNRNHMCTDCALKEHVKEYDQIDGFFLFRQVETDFNSLVQKIVDRYDSYIQKKKISFQFTSEKQPLRVKCDAERVEQVINNILETAIVVSNSGEKVSFGFSKSQHGLDTAPSNCVICTFEYPNRSVSETKLEFDTIEKDTRWKNVVSDELQDELLNLTIARIVIESQGGAIEVKALENKYIQLRFSLPLA